MSLAPSDARESYLDSGRRAGRHDSDHPDSRERKWQRRRRRIDDTVPTIPSLMGTTFRPSRLQGPEGPPQASLGSAGDDCVATVGGSHCLATTRDASEATLRTLCPGGLRGGPHDPRRPALGALGCGDGREVGGGPARPARVGRLGLGRPGRSGAGHAGVHGSDT
jgi:hypothetical protein